MVPVLNEGAQIERFLESLHQAIDQLANVEIVVVNDSSTDNSADEITKLCKRLPLRYLELSRNFGKEMAFQAGLDVKREYPSGSRSMIELAADRFSNWQ